MNRTRSVRMLAVLATAGLLVAACGGDDDDDSSAATDAPAGTEAAGRHRGDGAPRHRRAETTAAAADQPAAGRPSAPARARAAPSACG